MGNGINIKDGKRVYRIDYGNYEAYVYTDFEAKSLFGVDCASYTVLYDLNYFLDDNYVLHKGDTILLDCFANKFSVRASKACYESVVKLLKKHAMSSNSKEERLKNAIKSGGRLCTWWGQEFYLDNDFYVVFTLSSPKDLVVSSAELYKKPKRKLYTVTSGNCFGIDYDTYKPWCAGDTKVMRKVVARLCRNFEANYHQGITEENW